MHDPFIPGAICNRTLEQLTESTQPVIRERPPQRCSAVIAVQHQGLAAATSATTAEPRTCRSPVTRRRQCQQQRHSESPEPACPRAFQPPCSSSTSLSSPPSSTPSSSASSSSSSSMHPSLLAAATAGHHPMLLDKEQVSRQCPAAAAMSSYRSATALPVCTAPHHGQHRACTGATRSSWSSVPLPACSMQHIPAHGLVPLGNPAALQLPRHQLHVHEADHGRDLRRCLEDPQLQLVAIQENLHGTWSTVYYITLAVLGGSHVV